MGGCTSGLSPGAALSFALGEKLSGGNGVLLKNSTSEIDDLPLVFSSPMAGSNFLPSTDRI